MSKSAVVVFARELVEGSENKLSQDLGVLILPQMVHGTSM